MSSRPHQIVIPSEVDGSAVSSLSRSHDGVMSQPPSSLFSVRRHGRWGAEQPRRARSASARMANPRMANPSVFVRPDTGQPPLGDPPDCHRCRVAQKLPRSVARHPLRSARRQRRPATSLFHSPDPCLPSCPIAPSSELRRVRHRRFGRPTPALLPGKAYSRSISLAVPRA